MQIGRIWQFCFVTIIAFAGGQAVAQDASDCAIVMGEEFGDWQVYQTPSQCPRKECGVRSTPISTVNTRGGRAVEVRRGPIRLFITVSPPDTGSSDIVSFNSGYPFAKDSEVLATVDNAAEFTFLIGLEEGEEEWAWPLPPDDERIVDAMRKGNRIVMSGISGRGTRTKDTFSLKGLTASLQRAGELCAR